MHYITEIGLTSRFFQVYHSYHTVYHENSGTLPLIDLSSPVVTRMQCFHTLRATEVLTKVAGNVLTQVSR